MRKIDKDAIASKDFEKWHSSLKKDNHPKYNSSSNKYYFDIKMSLLYCQDGLCAYTEQRLCPKELLDESSWDSKKYCRVLTKQERDSIQGDLEHFDESLKKSNGWLWDNLFVVSTHVNCRIKGRKAIEYILKPDNPDYDPYKLLEYDDETSVFIANSKLSDDEKEKVSYMIETLGINCIYNQRKRRLKEWQDRLELGLSVEPDEYITAWEMFRILKEYNS